MVKNNCFLMQMICLNEVHQCGLTYNCSDIHNFQNLTLGKTTYTALISMQLTRKHLLYRYSLEEYIFAFMSYYILSFNSGKMKHTHMLCLSLSHTRTRTQTGSSCQMRKFKTLGSSVFLKCVPVRTKRERSWSKRCFGGWKSKKSITNIMFF